jgi:hypothetical protein
MLEKTAKLFRPKLIWQVRICKVRVLSFCLSLFDMLEKTGAQRSGLLALSAAVCSAAAPKSWCMMGSWDC